jgi:hypothetical protein
MKSIFYIGLALAAATFTACSDDNAGEQYLRENTVGVVSSNLSFDADAHQGGVKFTAPAGQSATATVNTTWATAEVTGDSVVVNVVNNPGLESRSAMLTIKSGVDSTNVPIIQTGSKFSYKGKNDYVIADKDTTLVLPFSKVGAEPKLLSDASDAVTKVEQTDTAFLVTIKANTTGEMRQLNLFLSNLGVQDTVKVRQGELKDFVGKIFYLTGYDLMTADENTQSLDDVYQEYVGKIVQSGKSVYFTCPQAYISKLPLTFDDSTLSFKVTGGNYMGTVSATGTKYRLYNSIWDYNVYSYLSDMTFEAYQQHEAGKMTDEEYAKFQQTMPYIFANFDSKKLSMVAQMNYTLATVQTATIPFVYGDFVDSGSNGWMASWLITNLSYTGTSYDANMLCIDAFTSTGEYEQPLVQMLLPEILHQVETTTAGAKPQRAVRKKPAVSLPSLKHMSFMSKHLLKGLKK